MSDDIGLSKCCGAPLGKAFYGNIICSECRNEIVDVGRYVVPHGDSCE